ncbi:sister-chromatid cohesion protein 3 [Artemisia annua]|uniref:Sister-chromatid cohesion protein 3 n=1 Tax=Artemisia annua TaxID=35608 RepID=A0A2U1MMV9_ARTAN|nr:sister-chromatid cohesion protein 3 [Artemisia annua]
MDAMKAVGERIIPAIDHGKPNYTKAQRVICTSLTTFGSSWMPWKTGLFCASVMKAVGERIVPAIDHGKPNYTKAQREMIESNKKNITVCMIKNYPQLMRKYMADKTKVPSLVEIIVHMDLELYSLKSQDQKFKTVLQLIKETFFKHGDKDSLRSCVRAINYCSSGSRRELKDYAQNKLKEVEDELVIQVKAAIRENGDDEYLLLVNMKRLYELQLTRPVPIESLYDDIIVSLYTSSKVESLGYQPEISTLRKFWRLWEYQLDISELGRKLQLFQGTKFCNKWKILPIRSLIESGFSADKRSDVRLYYGARILQRMAYQEGEADALLYADVVLRSSFHEVTSILVGNGVPNQKILKNF